MPVKERELVSHRPNVAFLGKRDGVGNSFLDLSKDRLVVFSERSGNLYKYGGDAYPVVWEEEKNGIKYGLILAADGVGQGGFVHPSLKRRLCELISREYGDMKNDVELSDEDNKLMLAVFLKVMFDIEPFSAAENDAHDAQSKEVFEYALRCFADVPVGGYYGGRKPLNSADEDQQVVTPFYNRDSQSLASRIACVWIYQQFRTWALDKHLTKWTTKDVNELRESITDSMYRDDESSLSGRVRQLFSYDDAPKEDNRNIYYLPATVAAWFYIDDGKKISAVALNCGDARCYKVDLADGVKQISDDDVVDGDKMSAFVHFGVTRRSAANGYEGYFDGTFRAAIVELQAPCALFACSDGVYDTCPQEWLGEQERPLGFENGDCSDILFENRMLKAFKRAYSLDDLAREIVFSFYGQNSPHGLKKQFCLEWQEAGAGEKVKKDDSGTFAAKLFSTDGDPLQLMEKLREGKDATTLEVLTTVAYEKNIAFVNPHLQSSEEQSAEEFMEFARDVITNGDFVALLSARIPKETLIAKRGEGIASFWGINLQKANLAIPFGRVLKANAVGIINYLLELHENGEDDPEIAAVLAKYKVAEKKEESQPKINYAVERERLKFETIQKAFYGDLLLRKDRSDVIVDSGRHVSGLVTEIENIEKGLAEQQAAEREARLAAERAADEAKKEAERAAEAARKAEEEARLAAERAEEARRAAEGGAPAFEFEEEDPENEMSDSSFPKKTGRPSCVGERKAPTEGSEGASAFTTVTATSTVKDENED